MKILYLGPDSGTCRQRRFALERLGHVLTVVDPFLALPRVRGVRAWAFHTGGLGLSGMVENYVWSQAGGERFDLVFVDNGELVSSHLVSRLRALAPLVVNMNLDNPFVGRDGGRWRLFRQALPAYDLFVSPRRSSAEAAVRAGARRVLLTDFAADELAHRPISLSDEDRARFAADVVFVGNWMPERGPFMARLAERGVPLRIYGPRWEKAPEFERLKPNISAATFMGDDYAKSLQGAKIAIGLLSKGNEDLHTTRSLEIPAMGVLLCAERTSEHLAMYEDGREAVFWDNADDCADVCLDLLKTPDRIVEIAAAGRRRVLENRSFNEPLMKSILDHATALGTVGDDALTSVAISDRPRQAQGLRGT